MSNVYQKLLFKLQVLVLQLRVLLLKQKLTIPNLGNPDRIILHHGGGWLSFDLVNEYHRKKWGFRSFLGYYIGYQYFIDREGNLTHGRLDTEEGAHTKGYNKRTIGVCLMGDGTKTDFTNKQYLSLEALLEVLLEAHNLKKSDVYGHLNFSATVCPSPPLYKWLLKWKT